MSYLVQSAFTPGKALMDAPHTENLKFSDLIQWNELIYHVAHHEGTRAIHGGCGFMLKPTTQGAYRHRVMPTMVMVAILQGTGTFTDWHRRSHPVHAGQVIILPPNKRHGVVQKPDGQWMEFYFSAPASIYRCLRELHVLPPLDKPHVINITIGQTQLTQMESLYKTARQVTQPQLPLLWSQCQLLLTQLLRQNPQAAATATTAIARQMHEAARLLTARPQQRIALEHIASQLNMSYEMFRKQFRQIMGLPPGDYRIERRMELARQLITEHHLSAKEVAYRLGYTDAFTFSKQFKKVTGMSPSTFRASL